MGKKNIIVLIILIVFGMAIYLISSRKNGGVNDNQNMTNNEIKLPETLLDQNKTYLAILKTSLGDIAIELNQKMVPVTATNFVYLANLGFYNGTLFHRVVNGFMIQGGDPECTENFATDQCGAGGPPYRFKDESFKGEYVRGTVAMANAGPNTNGSQFFIMHKDVPLQKNYVIFGKVVSGLDVVDKIASVKVVLSSGGEMSKPSESVVLREVEVKEK